MMVRLLLPPVVEPPENSCRMNRVFSIYLLLPVLAMAICRGKPLESVFDSTNVASWGQLSSAKNSTQFWFIDAKMEEKDFIDKMGVHDVVPRSAAAVKGCRVSRTRWVKVNKGSDDAPQLRARWVAQEFRGRSRDKHEYFSETPDLALVEALMAHAARRAEGEDIVVAVFDVRRACFYAEEKERETFLLSCRTVCLPNSGQRILGSCARRCTGLAQLQHRGEMS